TSLSIAALLFGCAASATTHQPPPPASTDAGDAAPSLPHADGAAPPSGTVSLTVASAKPAATIAMLGPTSGEYFAVTHVTLSNGASATVPAGFDSFSLQTAAALVLAADNASVAVDTPCALTTSLAAGGSITCNVVFQVPIGEEPATLLYDDHLGAKASAP